MKDETAAEETRAAIIPAEEAKAVLKEEIMKTDVLRAREMQEAMPETKADL